MPNVHDFTVTTIDGRTQPLAEYNGRVLLIVNTASRCGFTPQYASLEDVYEEFVADGFVVLGFPCNQFLHQEPGSNSDVADFCVSNYRVSFPLFAKIRVNGDGAEPLYTYLKSQKTGIFGRSIKWNFTKFLVDADGTVVRRYAPFVHPDAIRGDIKALLGN